VGDNDAAPVAATPPMSYDGFVPYLPLFLLYPCMVSVL
jgi:hypothetical protein